MADRDPDRLAWVFTNRDVTVYAIRDNRSSDVVVDILGREFKRILASDFLLAYDDRRLSVWLKQKCMSHLLNDLKETKESKSGRALQFARQMTSVLQEALDLKKQKSRMSLFPLPLGELPSFGKSLNMAMCI